MPVQSTSNGPVKGFPSSGPRCSAWVLGSQRSSLSVQPQGQATSVAGNGAYTALKRKQNQSSPMTGVSTPTDIAYSLAAAPSSSSPQYPPPPPPPLHGRGGTAGVLPGLLLLTSAVFAVRKPLEQVVGARGLVGVGRIKAGVAALGSGHLRPIVAVWVRQITRDEAAVPQDVERELVLVLAHFSRPRPSNVVDADPVADPGSPLCR